MAIAASHSNFEARNNIKWSRICLSLNVGVSWFSVRNRSPSRSLSGNVNFGLTQNAEVMEIGGRRNLRNSMWNMLLTSIIWNDRRRCKFTARRPHVHRTRLIHVDRSYEVYDLRNLSIDTKRFYSMSTNWVSYMIRHSVQKTKRSMNLHKKLISYSGHINPFVLNYSRSQSLRVLQVTKSCSRKSPAICITFCT